MTQIVRFTDSSLRGYGFDLDRNRLISYKRFTDGIPMDYRSSYRLNGYTRYHAALQAEASKLIRSKSSPFDSDPLHSIRPAFPYVLYSKKNQCSQYFFANTSIAEALYLLSQRGEVVAVEDVRVLNVDTGVVTKLQAKTVITSYTLV